jgi:hypothetical protein
MVNQNKDSSTYDILSKVFFALIPTLFTSYPEDIQVFDEKE